MNRRHVPTATEVETFSGQFVDLRNPSPETITLEDIAHALSNTCRYGGHCARFYSVAEHAVMVSRRLERRGYSMDYQLAGLHHDDSEAYLNDIPRPLKPLLGKAYQRMTKKMDETIAEALSLPWWWTTTPHAAIKDADNWCLFVEARHLLPSEGRQWSKGEQGAHNWDIDTMPSRIVTPDYWEEAEIPPADAKKMFLDRHKELTTS